MKGLEKNMREVTTQMKELEGIEKIVEEVRKEDCQFIGESQTKN